MNIYELLVSEVDMYTQTAPTVVVHMAEVVYS